VTTLDRVKADLHHVVVTTVTPFKPTGELDLSAIKQQVRHVIDGGVRVLIPCGNTGEFSSLSAAEARQVTAETVAAADPETTVIAGVGGPVVTAVELAVAAQADGASAIMIHPPAHTFVDRARVADYYRPIIDATNLGVVLYKRGENLTDQVIPDLLAHERVIGVKYGGNDMHSLAKLVDRVGYESCSWVCGTAERWAPYFWLAGARGFTSGLATFAPQEAVALWNALHAGDMLTAAGIRRRLTPFEDLREEKASANNVTAVKEAMQMIGLDSGHVRPPLAPLSDADRQRVRETLLQLGLIGS
jgi:4-hydroxy-tetrahydrodipicolinate synthase